MMEWSQSYTCCAAHVHDTAGTQLTAATAANMCGWDRGLPILQYDERLHSEPQDICDVAGWAAEFMTSGIVLSKALAAGYNTIQTPGIGHHKEQNYG